MAQSRPKPIVIVMDPEVTEELRALFFNPGEKREILQATITPQGTTYDNGYICNIANSSGRDPVDGSQLLESMLNINQSFLDLKAILLGHTVDVYALRRALRDPRTKKLFQQPVVVRGDTHDFDGTPVEFKYAPYINRFVLSVLQHQVVQKLLKGEKPIATRRLIEEQKRAEELSKLEALEAEELRRTQLSQQVNAYYRLRHSEGETCFGPSKTDKLTGATHLMYAVSGRISIHSFLTDPQYKKSIQVMRQGRARDYASDALQYLETKHQTLKC